MFKTLRLGVALCVLVPADAHAQGVVPQIGPMASGDAVISSPSRQTADAGSTAGAASSTYGSQTAGATVTTPTIIATQPMTYGTFNTAVGCSVVTNSTHPAQVLGFTTPSQAASYADRDSVGCYVDNTAPPPVAKVVGRFTTTTFVPTTPLTGTPLASLRVGMLIDTTDATKYTGTITGWARNGTSITVSGWFQQGNTAAGQMPSGPDAVINPITKIWAHNANVILNSNSYATAATGFELGILNNAQYNAEKDIPYTWGFDSVNLGKYTASRAFSARGDFNYGYYTEGGRRGGYFFNPQLPTQVGPAILVNAVYDNYAMVEYMPSYGTSFAVKGYVVDLGGQSAASSPELRFHASGAKTVDASLIGVAGSGAAYAGDIAARAAILYDVGSGGAGDWIGLAGGATSSGAATLASGGADLNVNLVLAPKGTGVVETSGLANAIASPGFSSTVYDAYFQSLLHGISPAREYAAEQGGETATDAATFGAAVPSSAAAHQVNGLASYVQSNRAAPGRGGGDVAGYFQARCTAADCHVWGIDTVSADVASVSGQTLKGVESDLNVSSASTVVEGMKVVLRGGQPANAFGFSCGQGTGNHWGSCFVSGDGSATNGAYIGATEIGDGVGSQALEFHSKTPAGEDLFAKEAEDAQGNLDLMSGAVGKAIVFRDSAGAQLAYINAATTSVPTVTLKGVTYAGLPACGSSTAGMNAYITDASVAITAWHQLVSAGGGSNKAFITCNGSTWNAYSY